MCSGKTLEVRPVHRPISMKFMWIAVKGLITRLMVQAIIELIREIWNGM
jgi:hypothetical protein